MKQIRTDNYTNELNRLGQGGQTGLQYVVSKHNSDRRSTNSKPALNYTDREKGPLVKYIEINEKRDENRGKVDKKDDKKDEKVT